MNKPLIALENTYNLLSIVLGVLKLSLFISDFQIL